MSLQARWLSICSRDRRPLRAEGPAGGSLDNPDWVNRSSTPPAPPPWSWEGAWLPAVIQTPPDLGALPPGLREPRRGALFVRCKTRPGFLPRLPRPLQGHTFPAVLENFQTVSSAHG